VTTLEKREAAVRLALVAVGSAMRQINSRWWARLLANLMAVLLSLPFVGLVLISTAFTHSVAVVTFLLVLVIGVLPNPAAAGVHYLSYELAQRQGIFLSDQWIGLRTFGGLAFKVWLLSLFGSAVIVGNIAVYSHWSTPVAVVARLIWIYILLGWVALHLYIYPLIMEQEVKQIRLIYRNAVVLAVSRPLFTIVALAAWLIVLLLTAATGLAALLGLALAASIQHNAAVAALPTFEQNSTELTT
jgi:hypothetical protein